MDRKKFSRRAPAPDPASPEDDLRPVPPLESRAERLARRRAERLAASAPETTPKAQTPDPRARARD
ncbi:hypothetical protein ACFQ4E_09895, partial [Litorisediminicola beolgyonensis]